MKRSTYLRRLLCLMMSFLLIFACASVIPASAATQTQMQSQINSLEAKSKKLEAEISKLKKDKSQQEKLKNALKSKVDTVQSEINLCNSKIRSYQAAIDESEKKIAQKNADMEENIRLFKERIRIIYMTNSANGTANILLGAEDFAEFLTLSALTGKVSARDKTLMEDISAAIQEIQAEEAMLQSNMDAQNSAKATLAEKKSELSKDMAEYDSIISGLQGKQKKLEEENKTYEKAIKSLENQIASLSKSASLSGVVYDGSQFGWPCPGYYTVYSPYGMRSGRMHKGIDISSSGIYGASVVSAGSGVVIAAGWNSGGYGNYVMVNHGTKDGRTYITLYGHLSSVLTSVGASVSKGTVIGKVGSTGRSSGPHLHYEIRVNGSAVNPMGYYSKVK